MIFKPEEVTRMSQNYSRQRAALDHLPARSKEVERKNLARQPGKTDVAHAAVLTKQCSEYRSHPRKEQMLK